MANFFESVVRIVEILNGKGEFDKEYLFILKLIRDEACEETQKDFIGSQKEEGLINNKELISKIEEEIGYKFSERFLEQLEEVTVRNIAELKKLKETSNEEI